MSLDTSKWPLFIYGITKSLDVFGGLSDNGPLKRVPVRWTTPYTNKVIPILPLNPSQDHNPCKNCIGGPPDGTAVIDCSKLPTCGKNIWVEATPENMAAYVAERMGL